MKFLLIFFLIFSFGKTLKSDENQIREKRQILGFPDAEPLNPSGQDSFTIGGGGGINCRGNRRNRPECQNAAGAFTIGHLNCRGRNKHLPQCQAQRQKEALQGLNCRGNRRNRPECQNQNQGGGQGGQGGGQGGRPSDEAIVQAFNQIPWLEQQATGSEVAIPDSESPQTRIFQLAVGARDEPFQSCFTPRFERGHCRYIQHCILPEFRSNFNIFLRYVCFIQGIYVGVCCPDSRYSSIQTQPPFVISSQPQTNRPPPPPPPPPTSGPAPTATCGVNTLQTTKIVGGRDSEVKKYPWIVALLRNGNDQYCGAILLDRTHVLTAAHCVQGMTPTTIKARLGEHDFDNDADTLHQDFNIFSVKIHEQYNSQTNENDIAVLTLEGQARYTDFIRPVCLPPPNIKFDGQRASVVGWGTLDFGGRVSRILQEVEIEVWNNTACVSSYEERMKAGMICAGDRAGGKDSCQGDSGGPLMLRHGRSQQWTVIGIVSWGIRCADPLLPGVYAEVSHFTPWINSNLI